ncbi:hypothetical protein Bbelb_339590, partial [Branchiostoma belcheri]
MGAKINSDNVIILGDFNTPGIKWDTTVADNSQAYTGQAEKLLNLMDNHGLFQTVQEPTRNGNLLDLVLVNNPNIIEKTTVVPGISDHDMVLVDVNLALKQNRKPKRKVYIRTKADEPAIKKDLTDYATNFHKRTQDMSVTQKWSDFKDKMKDTMNKHIPSKITSSRYNLPWFNRNLRRHCRKKQRLYNKAKKTGQEEDWNKYKRVKKGVQKSIRQAHSKYVADILGEAIVDKPKTFWSYIKGLRKDLVGVAPLKVGNTIISDSGKKAEVLSSQFKSVFTEEDTTDMPSLGQPCTPPMEHIVVSTDGVEKMLQGLNPSKASGPDQIPPWFLKLTASEIAPVLTNIFQHSLNTAEIPKDWRDANICAIFKKGDRAVPSNYRPVSLTCISCKLLEHIIHSQIMKHLESYSILTDYQHGFRAKRSTETQLILTVHDIAGALNSKRQVDLAILDFTKAFDKVPHGRLISKLEYYGIQGPTLNWLKAFLTNREQTVVVEGKASAPVKVASGVPQGTVLGPLLFLLYINDLPDQLDSTVRLFADDCLLYVELSTQTDSQLLQKDLNTLEEWQSKWLMQFNPEKCYIMHITNKRTPHATSYQFCGQALATTKIHPYLGVTLTSGLKWGVPPSHPHCEAADRMALLFSLPSIHQPLQTVTSLTLEDVCNVRLGRWMEEDIRTPLAANGPLFILISIYVSKNPSDKDPIANPNVPFAQKGPRSIELAPMTCTFWQSHQGEPQDQMWNRCQTTSTHRTETSGGLPSSLSTTVQARLTLRKQGTTDDKPDIERTELPLSVYRLTAWEQWNSRRPAPCNLVYGGTIHKFPRCLDTLPTGFRKKTREIYINHLRSPKLMEGSFPNLPRLEHLRIRMSNVSVIQPGAFRDLRSLISLDLSANQISSL